MRSRFYRPVLFVMLLVCCTAILAQEPESKPEQSELTTGLDSLLTQEQKGVANADLYNQIGLNYYHKGYTGKAVVWFLRALRLNSNHSAAKNNLDFVINRTLDKEMYTQPSFLASMFQKVFDFFNLNFLAIITLILLLITVFNIHWLLHLDSNLDKAVPVMWLIIFSFVFLLTSTMLGLKYSEFHNNSKAVVMEAEVAGYSGPGSEYGKLFTVHEGLIIHISRTDKEWALINLPNGGAGWIPASATERIKN